MARRRIWRALLGAAAGVLLAGPPAQPAALATPPRRAAAKKKTKAATAGGAWSGEYSYAAPVAGGRRVPFNAVLHDDAGVLTGVIDEPNTFGAPAAERLYAAIAGSRSGSDVFFVKQYSGAGGVDHAVDYAGTINPAGTRIEGTWDIAGFGGRFFMQRTDAGEELAEEREAEQGL
jgi:hypothetical protein